MKTTNLNTLFLFLVIRRIGQGFLALFRFTEADVLALLAPYGGCAFEVDRLQNNPPLLKKEARRKLRGNKSAQRDFRVYPHRCPSRFHSGKSDDRLAKATLPSRQSCKPIAAPSGVWTFVGVQVGETTPLFPRCCPSPLRHRLEAYATLTPSHGSGGRAELPSGSISTIARHSGEQLA